MVTNAGDTTLAALDMFTLPLVFSVINPNVFVVGLGDIWLWLLLAALLPPDALDGLIERDCDNDEDDADGDVAADGNDDALVFNVSVDALLWANIE